MFERICNMVTLPVYRLFSPNLYPLKKVDQGKNDIFSKLPVEIIKNILLFSNLYSYRKLSQVSRTWYWRIEKDHFDPIIKLLPPNVFEKIPVVRLNCKSCGIEYGDQLIKRPGYQLGQKYIDYLTKNDMDQINYARGVDPHGRRFLAVKYRIEEDEEVAVFQQESSANRRWNVKSTNCQIWRKINFWENNNQKIALINKLFSGVLVKEGLINGATIGFSDLP